MPRAGARHDRLLIAQISDIHCGSQLFDGNLLTMAVGEIRAMEPDLVLVGGDLTQDGYAPEFDMARRYLEPLLSEEFTTLVIPGNHDAKNVGYLHFGDLFGPGDVPGKYDRVLNLSVNVDGRGPTQVLLMGMDSTKPDLAEGEIGRERYDWMRQYLAVEADEKIFALHHHLVPVPGTGRERNTVWDAGDVLQLLSEVGVHVVLSGHKHVPYVWLVNGLLVVNSGTASSYRLRGYVRPSYNVIEITDTSIRVTFKYPGTGERFAGELDREAMTLHTSPDLAGMFAKAAWSA